MKKKTTTNKPKISIWLQLFEGWIAPLTGQLNRFLIQLTQNTVLHPRNIKSANFWTTAAYSIRCGLLYSSPCKLLHQHLFLLILFFSQLLFQLLSPFGYCASHILLHEKLVRTSLLLFKNVSL